jgi:hypothetical protein
MRYAKSKRLATAVTRKASVRAAKTKHAREADIKKILFETQ